MSTTNQQPPPDPLDRDAVVWIAGHGGLVGSALWRLLQREGFSRLAGCRSAQLDLRDRDAVERYVDELRPDVVVLAAARVGGIMANSRQPVEFLSDNLRIQANVLDAALDAGVPRLLFLGSSCIYPRLAAQPIREDVLLTGALEPTNDAYAIAKIAGLLQVKAVRRQYGLRWTAGMPTNLYGPGDNFDPENSHLIPGLLRRFHAAVEAGLDSVTCWGTGSPRRELLHVDDAARACLTLLEHPDAVTGDPDGVGHLNIGTGSDRTIRELAELVGEVVGYRGEIRWDPDRPDGTPRKLLDVSRIRALGWAPEIELADGLRFTYRWYREHAAAPAPEAHALQALR